MTNQEIVDRLFAMADQFDRERLVAHPGPRLRTFANDVFNAFRDEELTPEEESEADAIGEAAVNFERVAQAVESLVNCEWGPPHAPVDPGRLFFEFASLNGQTNSCPAGDVSGIEYAEDENGSATLAYVYRGDRDNPTQRFVSSESVSVLTARLNALLSGRS